MSPRRAGAWWAAAILLGLVALGLAWSNFGIATPSGWASIAFGLAAVACAVVAVTSARRAR